MTLASFVPWHEKNLIFSKPLSTSAGIRLYTLAGKCFTFTDVQLTGKRRLRDFGVKFNREQHHEMHLIFSVHGLTQDNYSLSAALCNLTLLVGYKKMRGHQYNMLGRTFE
jgi:hypothetical protein